MKQLQEPLSTMSITGFADPDRLYRKSTHRRNDSGELDVFEATRYFAGGTEGVGLNGAIHSQKIMREGRRMSLDMPSRNPISSQSHRVEKQTKEKKYKQPSSPGGRLASFLNSLFNQAASKKKKSKSTTRSVKDEEESPGGGRRKRRSSISHFQSVSTTDIKSMYSSTSSGFRTPPPYANTPTKGYKDLRSYSDHKQVVSLSKCNGQQVRSMGLQDEALDEKRNMDLAWLDEKFKFIDGFSDKNKKLIDKDRIWVDDFSSVKKDIRSVIDEVDDGAESDSSSDLFELQNYDLGVYSSGLPVYETTHMDSIKRGAPISNGPF